MKEAQIMIDRANAMIAKRDRLQIQVDALLDNARQLMQEAQRELEAEKEAA